MKTLLALATIAVALMLPIAPTYAHPGHGAAPQHGHQYNAAKRKAGKPKPRKPQGKGRQ